MRVGDRVGVVEGPTSAESKCGDSGGAPREQGRAIGRTLEGLL